MRIGLYWNPGAGDRLPLDRITNAIARAGHDIAGVLKHSDEAGAALRMNIDALVVAGGDGTVARAGRSLAGGELPIAILPLGVDPPDPSLDDAEFVNIVAQNLGVPESARQDLLEQNNVLERARALADLLDRK